MKSQEQNDTTTDNTKYKPGTFVRWTGVNRTETGQILASSPRGYLVSTKNGKVVILHEKSIIV